MSFRKLQQDRFMSPDIVAVVRLLQEGKVATECYYEFRPTERGEGRGSGEGSISLCPHLLRVCVCVIGRATPCEGPQKLIVNVCHSVFKVKSCFFL